jgi:hypothetical protein
MDQRDLLVTPIVIFLVYIGAYFVRPYVADSVTGKYFFPALTLKLVGAIVLGFIYQYYYNGGDTFNFHTHGSRHVWEAFMDSPFTGIRMLFSDGKHEAGFYRYSSLIPFFSDSSSFFVIKVAAFFDLFTFSTYSATAVFFAVIGFAGMWMFFLVFYRHYPLKHRQIAWAVFFIPSVFFWGSGILKDTLMMACLGVITFEVDRLFFARKISVTHILLLIGSICVIFIVKKFILQAFLPSVLMWIYLTTFKRIPSLTLRILIFPLIILISVFSIYYSVVRIGAGSKYAVEILSQTAKATAYDIRFQTGRDAGSGYTLGELDGTFQSMLRLAPEAINVSLFRPYLWEVRNPLMLLSAIENSIFLILTIAIFFKRGFGIFKAFQNPDIIFCLIFSLIYAFAVGVSSFNFGTLARYKIPLLPFFTMAIVLIYNENKPRKLDELEATE